MALDPRDPLPPGLSRETTIRRDAAGRWFHEGEPVENPAVARAFDRWIERAADGRYILSNSANWAYVQLEGAPFFVRELELEADQAVLLLSDDTQEALRPETLRAGPDGRLYCLVRDGTFVAEFTRRAMFALEPALDEDEDGELLRLMGKKVRPPVVDDPLALEP
jgi:hypothetical protein